MEGEGLRRHTLGATHEGGPGEWFVAAARAPVRLKGKLSDDIGSDHCTVTQSRFGHNIDSTQFKFNLLW